jgi:hypothetical protein
MENVQLVEPIKITFFNRQVSYSISQKQMQQISYDWEKLRHGVRSRQGIEEIR